MGKEERGTGPSVRAARRGRGATPVIDETGEASGQEMRGAKRHGKRVALVVQGIRTPGGLHKRHPITIWSPRAATR